MKNTGGWFWKIFALQTWTRLNTCYTDSAAIQTLKCWRILSERLLFYADAQYQYLDRYVLTNTGKEIPMDWTQFPQGGNLRCEMAADMLLGVEYTILTIFLTFLTHSMTNKCYTFGKKKTNKQLCNYCRKNAVKIFRSV
jgi:hypothetical protein